MLFSLSPIAPPRHVRTSGRDACWASPPAINQWLNWLSSGLLSISKFPKLIILQREPLSEAEALPKNMNNQKNVRSETIQNHIGDDFVDVNLSASNLSLSDPAQHPRLQVFRTAGLTCIRIDMFLHETRRFFKHHLFFCQGTLVVATLVGSARSAKHVPWRPANTTNQKQGATLWDELWWITFHVDNFEFYH